jgi:hypothetical protein
MYKNRQEKKLNFKWQVYIALIVNLPILRISEGVVFSVILELQFDYSSTFASLITCPTQESGAV